MRSLVGSGCLLIVVLLGAASAAWARSDFTPASSFSGPDPAVVRVVVPERNGAAYGSGALVAVNKTFGLVLTNWHVVRDAAGPIMVHFPDGFRSVATVLQTDRDWDLAALAIWRPKARPLSISNQTPRPGEELTIAGYGNGSYRAVTGRCTQYVSPGGNQPFEMIELSAPARNGDSGGPIFNRRGELAGVLFGSAFGRTTGSYCGRVQWFLNLVSDDFQRISAQTMLARQPRRNSPPVATSAMGRPRIVAEDHVASTPEAIPALTATTPLTPIASMSPNREAARAVSEELPAHAATQGSEAPVASVPAPLAGPLPTASLIKTILAAIGALAVFYHALRLLGAAVG